MSDSGVSDELGVSAEVQEFLSLADASDVISAAYWRSGGVLDVDGVADVEPQKRPLYLASKLMEIARNDPHIFEGLRIGKIVHTLKKEALSRV